MDPTPESGDAVATSEDRSVVSTPNPSPTYAPGKRSRSKARTGPNTGPGTTAPGPIADNTSYSQASPDPGTVEGAQNPEIMVDTPDAYAPASGFNIFGFGSMLDGLANRFQSTATSPAKAKAAQEDADFYVFIAESIVLSRTMSLAVLPSEQEHKLMVLGLADIIRSDGRVTRIAKGMKWVALPVGAGLWGLRMFTEYMTTRNAQQRARAAQNQAATYAPEFIPPPSPPVDDPTTEALRRMYDMPQPAPNGLEPQYGANKEIFG